MIYGIFFDLFFIIFNYFLWIMDLKLYIMDFFIFWIKNWMSIWIFWFSGVYGFMNIKMDFILDFFYFVLNCAYIFAGIYGIKLFFIFNYFWLLIRLIWIMDFFGIILYLILYILIIYWKIWINFIFLIIYF